jgi:hypothetical protein
MQMRSAALDFAELLQELSLFPCRLQFAGELPLDGAKFVQRISSFLAHTLQAELYHDLTRRDS